MQTVKANGITIAYEERGKGYPLVLIMGLGADGSLWEDHVKEYEKHFRCIIMDNRGAGRSDKSQGPYTTQMMAADTIGLMDVMGIAKAHIAGISMGSAIAQCVALSRPDNVESLVLVSSWARCDTYTKIVFESFKKMRSISTPDDFTELLQLWIYTAQYYESHYQEMIDGQKEALTNENLMPQHAFAAQCDACMHHDVLDRLPEITAPTLITAGDTDIFTPIRFSRDIHDKMPNSKLVVFQGWGHVHHWEDLEKFNSTTTKFLLDHTP